MRKFSNRSSERLNQCDKRLQRLLRTALQYMDLTVLEGHRDKETQNEYYSTRLPNGERRTKVQWPNSKHNSSPSLAVDVAPYPIDWEDRERFHLMGGLIMGLALAEGIDLRWGGDWDKDGEVSDNGFDDLVHFEIEE